MNDGSLTVSQRLERIEGQLNTVITLQSDLASRGRADLIRFQNHEKRIAEIEGWMKWGGRIVLALVLTAIVGMVLVTA